MNKIKRFLEEWLPGYARLPLFLVLMMNTLAYFGTRPFTRKMVHHSMELSVDGLIPLFTPFVYIYLLAYVQWVVGFVLIGRESPQVCKRFLYGEMIAKGLCLLCFVLYPTTIVRPEITGTGLADRLTAMVYQADAADNLFPSIHCLESYICFRSSLRLKRVPRWYSVFSFGMTVLVFASTVLLKQHVAVDMVGAVLVAEAGLFVTGWLFQRKKNPFRVKSMVYDR